MNHFIMRLLFYYFVYCWQSCYQKLEGASTLFVEGDILQILLTLNSLCMDVITCPCDADNMETVFGYL